MSISSINSGYQIMQSAQSMSNEAASNINEAAVKQNQKVTLSDLPAKDTVQKNTNLKDAEFKSPDQTKALTQLNQAETYGKVGANVIQRSNDMVGTLLDTTA